LKTIMLYGSLGKKFGKVHRYDVASPIEAVRAMSATISGFKEYMLHAGYMKILVGGKTDLDIEGVTHPTSDKETIRFVPVIQGAGGNFGKILLGAALVGLAIAFPLASATLSFGTFSASFSLASIATSIGTSLIIGGVSQMLFAPQQSSASSAEKPDNKPSFVFNGAINTSRQGNPVALAYGRVRVGSQIISAGIAAEQIL
jgi:predicted phage tail protein